MTAIDVADLKAHTEEILRQIQEQGETLDVVVAGRVVARLVPVELGPDQSRTLDEVWADMDRLADEISKHWPAGVTAVDAVREQRREP